MERHAARTNAMQSSMSELVENKSVHQVEEQPLQQVVVEPQVEEKPMQQVVVEPQVEEKTNAASSGRTTSGRKTAYNK